MLPTITVENLTDEQQGILLNIVSLIQDMPHRYTGPLTDDERRLVYSTLVSLRAAVWFRDKPVSISIDK